MLCVEAQYCCFTAIAENEAAQNYIQLVRRLSLNSTLLRNKVLNNLILILLS